MLTSCSKLSALLAQHTLSVIAVITTLLTACTEDSREQLCACIVCSVRITFHCPTRNMNLHWSWTGWFMQGGAAAAPTAVLTEGTIPAYVTQVLTGPQAQEADPLQYSDSSGSNASNPYNARIGVLRELHTKKSDRYIVL